MRKYGATRIFAKVLAANDNSKNQIYLGSGFAALNVIPHGEIYIDKEAKAGSKQDRPKAAITFFWIKGEGKHPAPGANLILYPDYPEVRLSGLLKGCPAAPNDLINERLGGRVIFFGVTDNGEVLGYVVADGHAIGNEVKAREWDTLGVFLELPLARDQDPKALLLSELKRIHEAEWINSARLLSDGTRRPYVAKNGGGYTLEAELGIKPNGYSEPDFHGWEVKQYGVRNFTTYSPKYPITLMTPEPTGGLYRTEGLDEFIYRYGYADRAGRAQRMNFGGIYKCNGQHHRRTGLRMTLRGFDAQSGKITDLLDGGIFLHDNAGDEAAFWSLKGLMDHWNRKHAQAAYVPSLARTGPAQYRYGKQILLCEGTDFILFLRSIFSGAVYYDPAIKMIGVPPDIERQRRNQFRVRHGNLTDLYHQSQSIDLSSI